MSVLFSDNFAGDFVNLGNMASRRLVDTGTVANSEHFWVKVETAFVQSNHLKTIILHGWRTLRSVLNGVGVEYNAALTAFTQSGAHDSKFFSFCYGKIDTYGLHKNLVLMPGLNDMAEADLPQQCSLSSDVLGAIKCPPESKRKWGGDDIADAIKDFSNSTRQAELAKEKISFMEKEDKRCEQNTLFDEWERIQVQLRSLREDLKTCTDDDGKAVLDDDIEGLLQQKKHVVSELVFK